MIKLKNLKFQTMKRIINKYFTLFCFIILLYPSCIHDISNTESDVIDINEQRNINLKIFSDSKVFDVPEKYELIYNDLLLIILDDKNCVEHHLYEKYSDGTALSHTDYNILLTLGSKKVLCFANLEDTQTFNYLRNLKIGNVVNDYLDYKVILSNRADISTGMPMSGLSSIVVEDSDNQSFEIDLIRMLAKVEFNIINVSGHKINLNSLSFHGVNNNDIYLFAKSNSNVVLPSVQTDKMTDKYIYPFNNVQLENTDALYQHYFYLNETVIEKPQYLFVSMDDIYTEFSDNNYPHVADFRKRFSFLDINMLKRNDYLKADIFLTNYKIDLIITVCNNNDQSGADINLVVNQDNEVIVNTGDIIYINPYIYDIYKRNYVSEDFEFKIKYEDTDSLLKYDFTYNEKTKTFTSEFFTEKEGELDITFYTTIIDATK